MNKLVVQQLKVTIQALSSNELDRLFQILLRLSKDQIKRTTELVGYKCYETKMVYETIESQGFGRDEADSALNCTKNFIDALLEKEDRPDLFNVLKLALKQLREPEDQSNFFSACNNSFDQNLDVLSKKIGNISMIKDYKPTIDNTLCLEDEMIKPVCCMHEQELKNERLKVEHLELRMKLILEENRILKSMEQQRNPTLQDITNQNFDTKRNSRSKQPQQPLSQRNKVPKLNLDILPNYHAKQPSQSINQYLLNIYCNNHKDKPDV